MITFIPRNKVSKNWTIIGPILSIFLTVFFGLLIFTFLGYNPLETLYQIFIEPKGEQLIKLDEWKEKFLTDISERYSNKNILLAENKSPT